MAHLAIAVRSPTPAVGAATFFSFFDVNGISISYLCIAAKQAIILSLYGNYMCDTCQLI